MLINHVTPCDKYATPNTNASAANHLPNLELLPMTYYSTNQEMAILDTQLASMLHRRPSRSLDVSENAARIHLDGSWRGYVLLL
jgi:hypothetical protein